MLQANIFFFITSGAVVVLTVLVAVFLYQLIKISREARRVIDHWRPEALLSLWQNWRQKKSPRRRGKIINNPPDNDENDERKN